MNKQYMSSNSHYDHSAQNAEQKPGSPVYPNPQLEFRQRSKGLRIPLSGLIAGIHNEYGKEV